MNLHQIGLVTDRQALLPAALDMGNGTIRIFVGLMDEHGMSRIHTIDVNAANPSEVYHISDDPVLGLGEPGCFDEHGVVPADVFIYRKQEVRLDYSGFQKVGGNRFLLLGGAASSGKDMKIFRRFDRSPFLTRCIEGVFVRAGVCWSHDDVNTLYYASGSDWYEGKPCYEIYSTLPKYTHDWYQNRSLTVRCKGDEYRIGKPHVWHKDYQGHMLCTAGDRAGGYYLVYLNTPSGHSNWERDDLTITGDVFPSPCYAYRCGEWVFFNGSKNGKGGIGYGKLDY